MDHAPQGTHPLECEVKMRATLITFTTAGGNMASPHGGVWPSPAKLGRTLKRGRDRALVGME